MLVNNKTKMKKHVKKKKLNSEVKLVLLNEVELIRQVAMRPVIYDRSLKAYRKTTLRQQCWMEISQAMEASVEECRKRWRSLRDSFTKHYKLEQKSEANATNKHRKWVFYDKMLFLIPHLDGVSFEFDKILDDLGDISEDGQSMNCEQLDINISDNALVQTEQNVMTNELEDLQKSNDIIQHSSVSVQATEFTSELMENQRPQQPIHLQNGNMENNATTSYSNFHRPQHMCAEPAADNCAAMLDADEKFLLSCAPTLRRLTVRQNALARLKIQQLLFDIEFQQDNN